MAAGDTRMPTAYTGLVGTNAVNPLLVGCTNGGDLYTFAHRTLTNQHDATLNDSNKTFTVPAGRQWWIHFMYVRYTSTVTAGDRQLTFIFTQALGQITFNIGAGTVQAPNTTRTYNFAPGVPHETIFTTARIYTPLPPRLLIAAAGAVQVLDENAVDAAADDMTVNLAYDEITI